MSIPPKIPPPSTTSARARAVPLVIAITAFALLIAIAIAALAYIHNQTTPRHSIAKLRDAIQNHDRQGIRQYVDAPQLAASIRRFARESLDQKTALDQSDDLMSRLLRPVGEQIQNSLVDTIFTPKSVISMLAGDPVHDIIKRRLNHTLDHTIDQFTQDASPKVRLYTTLGKGLAGWALDFILDEAHAQATRQIAQSAGNKKPVQILSTQYETPTRYLITIQHYGNLDNTVGFVFQRHTFTTWKLTEIRLLNPPTTQPLTLASNP